MKIKNLLKNKYIFSFYARRIFFAVLFFSALSSSWGATYRWKNSVTNTETTAYAWADSSNWEIDDGTGTYTDAPDGSYPGSEDNDTAIIAATNRVYIGAPSLAGSGWNLTINSSSSVSNVEIGHACLPAAQNTSTANITLVGTQTIRLQTCDFGSLTLTGGVKVWAKGRVGSAGNEYTLRTGNLTVRDGAELRGFDGAVIRVTGDLLLEGQIYNYTPGDYRFAALYVEGDTTIAATGILDTPTAKVEFNGDVSVSGSITPPTTGSLTYSTTDETCYINQDKTLTAADCSALNGKKVYFYNTVDEEKTFTIGGDLSLDTFIFGGNVSIDLQGDLTADSFKMLNPDSAKFAYVSHDFTSTINTNGHSVDVATAQLTRCSSTDGVAGTFVFDGGTFEADFFAFHSGVNLKASGGAELNLPAFGSSAASSDVPNSIIVDSSSIINVSSIELNKDTEISNNGTINITSSSDFTFGTCSGSGTINFEGGSIQPLATDGKLVVYTLNINGNTNFANGKIFEVGRFKAHGADDSHKIELSAVSASSDSDDWWTLDCEKTGIDVENAKISYCKSEKDLTSINWSSWGDNHKNVEEGQWFTTSNWFARALYWIEKVSNSWNDAGNWFYNDTSPLRAAGVPATDGNAEITISQGKLILESDVKARTIKVKEGATLDFATYSVEVSSGTMWSWVQPKFEVEDGASLRFSGSDAGSQSVISGQTQFHGGTSGIIFEYYGGGKVNALKGENGANIPNDQFVYVKNAGDGTLTHLLLGENNLSIKNAATDTTFNEGIIEINDSGNVFFSNPTLKMASGVFLYSYGNGSLPTINFYDLQINGGIWNMNSSLSCQNFYFTGGKISIGGGTTLSVNNDFVVLGSNYDEVDHDWHNSSNTRFSYPEGTSGFFMPDSPSAEFDGLSGTIIVKNNLYVNGADLNGAKFHIPSKTAPSINPSDEATATMWGSPYAVVFNSAVSNCTASPIGTSTTPVYVAAAEKTTDSESGATRFNHQNCTNGGGNTNFQFDSVEIKSAKSVSDNVIFVELEKEVLISQLGSLANTDHISYNSASPKKFGKFYEDEACTSEIDFTTAVTSFYIKAAGTNTWNTDATGESKGSDDSTDLGGNKQTSKIGISMIEGFFYLQKGYTLSSNYYGSKAYDKTEDGVQPVLIAVYTGREEHKAGAANQKTYDAHNFIELRYSEPVSIGDLSFDATDDELMSNVQAQTTFTSESEHGGALVNAASGFSVFGFGAFSNGKVNAGFKNGSTLAQDTSRPHSIYRKFPLTKGGAEEFMPCRLRISVAGYVDGSVDGFNKWIGYISAGSVCPTGSFSPSSNLFIKDASGNEFKPTNPKISTYSVKTTETSLSNHLYGTWDVKPPVFAPYIEDISQWATGSNPAFYELVGTVTSNTSSNLDRIEFHLFDDEPRYNDSDAHKWVTKKGWSPATGTYAYIPDKNGGIRRSSLDGASSAFTYKYKLNGTESTERNFGNTVSQDAKSSLFSSSTATVSTNEDEPYFAITLNSADSDLPLNTTFTVTFDYSSCCITDLAGNRLVQVDTGSLVKILHTKDITPPSFSIVLAPIGSDKIYAVFTKTLWYKGHKISAATLDDTLKQNIAANIDFSGFGYNITNVEFVASSNTYTSLLFTVDKPIMLSDLKTNTYLEINDNGEDETGTFGVRKTCYLRDSEGNGIPVGTKHALSDFAINAVEMVYAFAEPKNEDGWNEKGIYGDKAFEGYPVHDFSADGKNYSRLLGGHDIVFQYKVDADNPDLELSLVYDKKSSLKPTWISDRYNLLTGSAWRLWLDARMDSLSTSHNSGAKELLLKEDSLAASSEITFLNDDDNLKTIEFSSVHTDFPFASSGEYQFFFKIMDGDSPVLIDHDGDDKTDKIPLYAFSMPKERIAMGDFLLLDLWSVSISSVVKQRGGVSILNNVINPLKGERTSIEIDMKESGNLSIYVMTLDGNIIKRLSKGNVTAGTHYYYWDGKNNAGNPVARGLYFVRVAGSGIDETRKVMVVK